MRLLLIREAAIYLQSQANRGQTVIKSNVQPAAVSSKRAVYLRKRYQVAVQSLPDVTSPRWLPVLKSLFSLKYRMDGHFIGICFCSRVYFFVAKTALICLVRRSTRWLFFGIVCVNKRVKPAEITPKKI